MVWYLGGSTTTAVACTSDTEVFEGVLGVVEQEFVFSRLIVVRCIGLYLGHVLLFSLSSSVTISDSIWLVFLIPLFFTQGSRRMQVIGTETPDTSVVPTENTNYDICF